MRAYLIQHGTAVPKETDADRPLDDPGTRDAARLGAFLRDREVAVTRGLHSDKTRARQTAEIVLGAAAPDVAPEETSGLAPKDPPEAFAERMAQWSGDTLVAGHQPFLGALVSRLLCGRDDGLRCGYVPGTAVCVERDDDGAWTLVWMLPPDLLP